MSSTWALIGFTTQSYRTIAAPNGSSNTVKFADKCADEFYLNDFVGPIVYLTVAGQPVVVLNTIKGAADLFDRRADIYSDRLVFPILGPRDDSCECLDLIISSHRICSVEV